MGFTCLMQLSTRDKDYIIDTIALRSKLQVLNKIFTDPKVIKILHGCRSDIMWLQKDLGLYMVNLFDTGEASKVLGLKGSLGFLLKHYCNVDTDKKFQLADWRQRPLPEEMNKYARMDTHYLFYIYDKMRLELAQPKSKEENPIAYLSSVWKTSKDLCLQIFEKPKAKDNDYFAIVQRNATLLGEGQMEILQTLLIWRDYIARIEDESIKFVMPNDVLFDIAKSTPRDFTELELILRRHPKHTHHESIIKYEEDLIQRINAIIANTEKKIENRVNNKKNSAMKYCPFESSSSSEEESKVSNLVTQKKENIHENKPILASDKIEVTVQNMGVMSEIFSTSRKVVNNDKNINRINEFNQKVNVCEIMGIAPEKMPEMATRPQKSLQAQIDECMPTEIPKVIETTETDLKDAVLRVDEVDVQQIHIPKEKSDSESEEDKNKLPPSMREKYDIKKKSRRSKNKRIKTGEESEIKNPLVKQNKETVMQQIKKITKKVKSNITNKEEKTGTKSKKR